MAFLSSFTFPLQGDPIIDAATQGSVWNLSSTNVMHWTLADGWMGESWGSPEFALQQIDQVLSILETYINVDFQYGGYFANPLIAGQNGSDLVYSLYGDDRYGADPTWAVGFFPSFNFIPVGDDPGWATQAGDIFVNINHPINSQTSFEIGSAGFALLLHETLHALGLKHTFDIGNTEVPRPTLSDIGLEGGFDVDWFSVMSYSDNFQFELNKWDPGTPMLLDVLALQFLYGANTATGAGDTSYALGTFPFYATIWDADGTDEITAATASEGWSIYLPSVQLSTLLDTLAGYAVPLSQDTETLENFTPTELIWLTGTIENAVGSTSADRIEGSNAANVLSGLGGNDSLTGWGGDDQIDGGAGVDVAVYEGSQTHYTLALSPDGTVLTDRRADGQGSDVLSNIEILDFDVDLFGAGFDLRQFGGPSGLSAAQLESFVELYIAYFNRAPDAVGLNFWGTAFANGTTLREMAALFVDQPETRATYPDGTSNEDFATSVYTNVLGRTPDQSGIQFWVGLLDNGSVGRDTFILLVLEGAKSELKPEEGQDFVNQQLADRAYLETKTDIGAYFAVHRGMSNVENAATAMAFFDGSEASVAAAVAAIDGFHAAALDPVNGEFLMPLVGVLDTPFVA